MTDADVERWREEFPMITQEGRIHLNNCSASPIPERGLAARRECERVWITEGNPWGTWLEKVNESKRQFADLIGADSEEVAVQPSATAAIAQVAAALDYDDSDEVVVSDLEFPTVPQFWYAQGKRGAKVRWAESDDGVLVEADAYEDAMSDDTLMVSTAHAHSFTGGLIDVGAVADAVHDRGGYLFLDAYQSVGIADVDVEAMDVDVLVAGALKFLMGGPGIAYLYVDDDVVSDLEPFNLGWFGVDDVFGFETREPKYAPNARRFELGTPQATNAYQASAGMELVREVGLARIRERVVAHTNHLIDGAKERGFAVRTPERDEYRGGVVNVQVADPPATEAAMLDAGFNLSSRGGGVRLAPHFYNTAEEMEAALDAVEEFGEPTDGEW